MLSRTLISRPNVEKLVRMADLDLKNDSKSQQETQVENLMKALEIKSTARDNLYTLAYRDSDGDRAKRVIQSLVSIFVESSLGASRKDTDSAKLFISEQIKAYEAKLEAAETKLKEFRLKNIELQPADGKDTASRLGELSSQLEQARLELREAETARDSVRQQLEAEKANAAASARASASSPEAAVMEIPVATPELDARIAAQKTNLDGLLQRYTDQHPDVVSGRRLIKELEEQKRQEVAELRKKAVARQSEPGGKNNVVVEGLNRMLAESEVQVASLRARVGEYSSRYNQARNMLKTAPQLEAEAAQLNRDYNINKRNYEDLVSRRQAAVMSGDLESASAVADFRLVDPPRVSPKAVSPNRLVLFPRALVVALAAGLFVAFAASRLRPVFYKGRELTEALSLPLLGVVSMVLNDSDRARDRLDKSRFALASGALIGTYIVLIIATTFFFKQ
jgi:polysaccharide chain length determinant protein (PEP-CTERM system associated)